MYVRCPLWFVRYLDTISVSHTVLLYVSFQGTKMMINWPITVQHLSIFWWFFTVLMWIFWTNHNMGLVRFLWISSVLMWILWCGLCPFIVMLGSNVDMWKISLNRTEHLTSFHFWYQLSFVPCVRRIPLGVIVSVIQRFDVHFWQVYSCLMWML